MHKTDSNKTRRRQTPAGGDDDDDDDEKQKRKRLENKVYKQCSICHLKEESTE